ncbi:MAG: hypothetical protein JWM68_224, partial [Verrucomicrobiales bacterium]|nr:hypothetical protein [Verrucomicrobiales bacterium]
MTYLGRPVFDFPVNWAKPANKSFTYDLKEVSLGFGAAFFTSLQAHVVQGWQFQVDLTDGTQIESFDAFTGALFGRVFGFWFPAPMEGMKVTASVDTTHFDIKAQGLAGTWQDHPDVYLFFARDGYASAAAKITNVVDNGATERVTINAAVNVNLLHASAMVSRLHYVRLASDEESGEFPAQNWQTRFVKVVELPKEYAAVETGQQKIFLYHFWANYPIGVHWYYTGFAANVVSNNVLYTKFGIEHGGITQSTKGDAEKIKIEAKADANHPFSLYLPLPFPRPLNVEVSEVDYSALDTQTRLFTGQVRTVEPGETLTAQCD